MIYVICGPTGVGKTKLSEELAKKLDAIIINSDAVQVYKKLDIGSAKVRLDEMQDVDHYLFDIMDITESYTVYDYQKMVRELFEKNQAKNIIMVGGTGLYISAALFDYEFSSEEKDIEVSKLTNEELYKLALKKDKNMDIDINNRVRLERFVKRDKEGMSGKNLLYDAVFIGLTTKRDVLYDKINKRVDKMFNDGLLEEVKSLYSLKDKSRVLNSAIGYKEVIMYLDGLINKEEMIDLIKKNSRHYAKRQYTWFNNKMNVNWFEVDYCDFSNTIKEVEFWLKNEEKYIS